MKRLSVPVWITLALCVGCGEKADEGRLVEVTEPKRPQAQATPTTEVLTPPVEEPKQIEKAEPREIDAKVTYEKGKSVDYSLSNAITVYVAGERKGETVRQDTFLNASQKVQVGEKKAGTSNVTITTSNVTTGFLKVTEDVAEADKFLKKTAESIEGSVLRGDFDSKGKGSHLALIGDGVGLNPMGPQVGSQEVMVGFMGILLPGKPIKIGDEWSAKYDFSQSASDLFGQAGAKTENSEVNLTYKLLDFDRALNFVRVSIVGKGAPSIKIPTQGAMLRLDLKVDSVGEAMIRLDDGWLQELRLETTVVMEGFVASKQVVKTITNRLN